MSKKEEQPDRLKQFISWVDGDREPKDRTLFVMEQRPHREFRPSEEEFERREKDRLRKFFNWYPIAAAVICVALGIILFTTVMNMPGFGQEDNPINNEVAERYLEHSEEETGSENVVTAMIIGYRGFDTLGESCVLFLAVSVVLATVLTALVQPILSMMSTPAEAVPGAAAYLTICFIGIPCITVYNIIASIFRGLGDSRSPMYFIAVACAANIGLDYLFMGALHMGPAGAALGTTLAQGISVIVSLGVILRRKSGIRLHKNDLRPQKNVTGRILRIGVPVALQDGLIQISFLLITVIANRRGLTDAAAVGIVEKIISFIFLVPSSMLSTVSALGAQNVGAGKHDRAAGTLYYAIGISLTFGAIVGVLVQFIAPNAVALFTTDAAVAVAGGWYLRGYIWDCFFAGIHFSFSGYFCAYGRSELSFLHNILAIVLVRVPGAYFMSKLFPDNLLPMGLATAVGSLLSVLICLTAYLLLKRKGTFGGKAA